MSKVGPTQVDKLIVDSDPVANALRTFMDRRNGLTWTGPAGSLLDELTNTIRPDDDKGWRVPKTFPPDATRLSSHLKRAAPALRLVGIDVTGTKKSGRRQIHVARTEDPSAEGTLEGTLGTLKDASDPLSVPSIAAVQAIFGSKKDARDANPGLFLSVDPEEKERDRSTADTASLASLASFCKECGDPTSDTDWNGRPTCTHCDGTK